MKKMSKKMVVYGKSLILFVLAGIFLFTVLSSCDMGNNDNSINSGIAPGWESASVTWQSVSGADSYNVYYKGAGVTEYKKIDTQLIREYEDYFRADILGLANGSYDIKICAAAENGTEFNEVTESVTVSGGYDRSGYAFVNGRIPGAYKADGTPKDNAVIVYVTNKTKNTVSMDVEGAENPCIGLQAILDGYKKGRETRPLIVRLIGQISDLSYMLDGDIVIETRNNDNSYITIEGVGNDATADGWGIRIKNASNVEIRNIGFMNTDSGEGDNVSLQQGNEYIWVHNNDLFYGEPGGDADQAKGDGAMDTKKSFYVTFSYNHFWDTGKTHLVGNKEGINEQNYITLHHNWYDHSDSRHPRVRVATVHVYNNYYDGVSKYGAGATMGADLFVEANYFKNTKRPMLISMQGSDIAGGGGTFSGEDGGMIKAYNNYMDVFSESSFKPYSSSNMIEFDAYVVNSRREEIPAEVTAKQGGDTYNNFDTASSMYSYTADTPEQAREKVVKYAGRLSGGDFKWTFTDADNTASDTPNPGLKAALSSYKTKLVSVQGDSSGEPDDGTDPGDNNPPSGGDPNGERVCTFDSTGGTSSFYAITGNISTSKGSVTVGGNTYSICLKMETSTKIEFTTSEEATLTLVFAESGKRVKVDSETLTTDQNGYVTKILNAGTHLIEKGDSINLFYIDVSDN
jgi:pectate lyase